MGPSKTIRFLYNRAIFYFRDYGRKGDMEKQINEKIIEHISEGHKDVWCCKSCVTKQEDEE